MALLGAVELCSHSRTVLGGQIPYQSTEISRILRDRQDDIGLACVAKRTCTSAHRSRSATATLKVCCFHTPHTRLTQNTHNVQFDHVLRRSRSQAKGRLGWCPWFVKAEAIGQSSKCVYILLISVPIEGPLP